MRFGNVRERFTEEMTTAQGLKNEWMAIGKIGRTFQKRERHVQRKSESKTRQKVNGSCGKKARSGYYIISYTPGPPEHMECWETGAYVVKGPMLRKQ